MDGVLADVSQSYRQAIIQTAHVFAAPISLYDITAAKAAGNANNDWILTHRLIVNHHTSGAVQPAVDLPSLEMVTQKFEEIYQGTASTPGLNRLEMLLVSPELLHFFHSHFPLAIVTGRPRSDALKFLVSHNIETFFKCVVCMEDAPPKPNPEPVILALQKLGVQRAIMIGDTPDDICAAVGAGIQGIGILSPGDRAGGHSSTIKDSLLRGGAAKIIDSVADLKCICPTTS